jgi:hypothetical protein
VSTEDSTSQSSPDIDALQAEIEETRRDLADTVDALTDKLDVKARTRARFETGRQQAVEGLESARSQAVALTGTVRSTVQEKATDEDGDVRREVVVASGVLVVALAALVVLGVRGWRS